MQQHNHQILIASKFILLFFLLNTRMFENQYNQYQDIMESQHNQLNLLKLKRLINSGIESIPHDQKHSSAIMVIGDTGVGKTTILSFLAKRKLYVKVHGLNTILDSDDNDGLKIGHDRFSETRVPTKIMIDNMVFFDCSGFKDNRGEEFEISNSFFVQRLFNIYSKIKILLIVDENSISESRADKLPKLIRNLLNSFQNLSDIQDGVILLINKAKPEFNESVYCEELMKMAKLKGNEGYLFNPQERAFLEFLVKNKRISLFKQAKKQDEGKVLEIKEENLLKLIRDTNFVKSKKIKNIISESAKLSIREYIDRLALDAEEKIKNFSKNVVKQFTYESQEKYGVGLESAMETKKRTLAFNEAIQSSSIENLMTVLTENTKIDMGNLQEGICTVIFFKEVYNKAEFYVKLLKSTTSAEINKILMNVDQQINRLQEEQRKFNELESKYQEENKKVGNLESQLQKNKEELAEAQKQMDKMRKKHQFEISNLQQLLKNKQKQCNEASQKIDQLQSQIVRIKDEFEHKQTLCAKQKQQHYLQYEKKINELQVQITRLGVEKNELKAVTESMRQQIEEHIEELEMLQIENGSLKKQLDYFAEELSKKQESLNESKISNISKTSKYPEVVCPHFKNGGKCVHCIKAWKKEQKEKKKMEKQLEEMNISDV